MSSDNHDRSRIAHKSQRASEECTFDTRKIKKERNEICGENGSHTNAIDGFNVLINDSGNEQTLRERAGAGSRLSNGIHNIDILQDIISAKLTSNAHGPGSAAKNEKIRHMIEESISDESKSRVQEIYLSVEQLTVEEKLLLYLKLPTSLLNPSSSVDPLRQPLNPLGNRYEIHQTIMWIKTHLEEDPDVSLPKQEVYDEYNFFCMSNLMKPLSTADFGKVMKQVYPRVRPRRLGTRGNSRYCYAGMRKRVKLDTPTLPAILGTEDEDFEKSVTEEMLGAASTLIREWAESTLGHKFQSLSALARHLVQNLCVNTRSLAAVCILSASEDSSTSSNKILETPPKSSTPIGGKSGKSREVQLQLQKKLQQRENSRDQKHRQTDSIQNHNKDKSIETRNSIGKICKKTKSNQYPPTNSTPNLIIKSTSTVNRSKKLSRSASQACTVSPQLNCDNTSIRALEEPLNGSCLRSCTPNNSSSPREIKAPTKTSRKRISLDQTRISTETSPEKQAKLSGEQESIKTEDLKISLPKVSTIQRPGKILVISPSNVKTTKLEVVDNSTVKNSKYYESAIETQKNMNGRSTAETNVAVSVDDCSGLTKDPLRILQEDPTFLDKNDKLCTIDTDALDDYLNGGNNSQEPEEELLQYFQQSNSSSSDNESIQHVISTDTDQTSRSDQVSQLRLILQQNLKGTVRVETSAKTNQLEKSEVQKEDITLPILLNHQNQTSSRRRVSFETSVVEHVQESSTPVQTIPQSPNTRRRTFNFTPISPSPHSPSNGRASKPNSANASPFVSPRNTPVPRSRSNVAGVCRSRTSQKSLSRSTSCIAPYTGKTDIFVVPSSNNETLKSSPSSFGCPKNVEVQVNNNIGTLSMGPDKLTSLLNDINPQKQLLINYPSQENLLEIKNVHRRSKPADQEISELLNSVKPLSNELYRSQSVPLHRMVNPALMSPISTGTFQSYHSVNPSTSSSLVHTPVPSEFDDFGSIGQPDNYLLDDTNFMNNDQQFLMEEKEISSENITKILNFLGGEDGKVSNILPEQSDEIINDTDLILDSIPNSNLNVQETMLDPSTLNPTVDAFQKIIQSRSYPNTPLPPAMSYPSAFTEDSNGSRSYPSTPLHTIQPQEVYQETNEPMLSSPTLNSLNLQGEPANADSTDTVCRNVSNLLESNFLEDVEVEDNLNSLSNFDGLQDVDSLTPLFNEVSETNQ
ncbi:uncharacterized protein [Chelonus insularis]|uniref:uncharacterized protein n=1 Tax=Chelonus insularis TaxID=460826 RepID=UPI00158B6BA9|nr:uncharacterized protein LOC118071256 [Chelonus insularis]